MPKKSIILIGLNTFFFASITESRVKFFKLFLQKEQVCMDEKLVTMLLFEIESSAFVFSKSLHLSPLNSKSLENS